MYSRYAGYQPFIPMNNRLSRFREEGVPPVQELRLNEESAPLPLAPPLPPQEEAAPAGGGIGLEQLLAGLSGGKGASGGKGLFGGKGLLGGGKGLLGGLLGRDSSIGSLLKGLRLDWDIGDILLILILLFISLDGEDDEIIWILAAALITGL